MSTINHEWEGKCRRCGNVETWVSAPSDAIGDASFQLTVVSSYYPTFINTCMNCGRRCVFDLVSYQTAGELRDIQRREECG